MADLRDPRLMVLKAFLFVVIGITAAGLLFFQSPTLRTALLLALCAWAFARFYYFCFYVIERYIDPAFRYAGLFSALRCLWRRPPGA